MTTQRSAYGLTHRQAALLAFIRSKTSDGAVSPSFKEMAEASDLRSVSGVHRLLTALEERGFIRRLPNRARSIVSVEDTQMSFDLEVRVLAYCRAIGITRPVFDQRAAESLLRGRA